jgi:alcohol dehydrogenase
MKAICLEKPGQFTTIELPEPEAPSAGQALVRVHSIGVCGTDISGYLGKMPLMRYPRILGHELGVEVVSVGQGVTHIKVGDRCAVEPYLNCGTCSSCRRGHINCCENLEVLGVHTDGGMRPYFLLPAHKLHPSPTLTLEQLALVETLGIGCHAVDRGQVQASEPVLIIGAGPIGLAVLEFVRLAQAEVAVLDVNERRLAFCRDVLGVKTTVRAEGNEGDVDRVRATLGGELPLCVFDATGNSKSMAGSFQHVGFHGRLVFVGIVPDAVSFPDPLLHRREMTVMGSRNALPGDFRRILGLIESGQIDTAPWITHHTDLGNIIADFPRFCDPATGVVKAMIGVGG